MDVKIIDLNCDLGEGFEDYKTGNVQDLIALVSSVNIACGFHAGGPSLMRKTVRLALQYGVSIGAHPGLPDREGFGRRVMKISPEEVYEIVLYQTGALWAIVKAEGGSLRHVKPHGALYNMAATDADLAAAIAEAIYKTDPELTLYGLSGSRLPEAAENAGLKAAHEVFADRAYTAEGTLAPRQQEGALLKDEFSVTRQVLQMVREGKVRSIEGKDIFIKADTLCIHGDHPGAPEFARKIRQILEREGIRIRSREEEATNRNAGSGRQSF